MKRFDFRDEETFKKDILFSTQLEEFWIQIYLKQIQNQYDKIEYEDYGTDNTGQLTKYATSKADYKIITYKNKRKQTKLLDVKWGPTKGKVTFKVAPLQKYIQSNTSILLFYNTGDVKLKKPQNYKFQDHINLINKYISDIRYTVINPAKIKTLLEDFEHKKVRYMGDKLSIIIPSSHFLRYWKGKKIEL